LTTSAGQRHLRSAQPFPQLPPFADTTWTPPRHHLAAARYDPGSPAAVPSLPIGISPRS